jgi:hypothetical protein
MKQEFRKPTNLIKSLFMAGIKKSSVELAICSANIEVKTIILVKRDKK